MKNLKSILTICAVAITIASCQKDTPGPQGSQGPAGTNGNANVESLTETTTEAEWSSTPGPTEYYLPINIGNITSAVLSSSSVEVFFSFDNGFSFYALPYTVSKSTINYFLNYRVYSNNIELIWTWDGTGYIPQDPFEFYGVSTVQIKMVVIPPAARMANPNLNLTDYEEIKTTFHLKD